MLIHNSSTQGGGVYIKKNLRIQVDRWNHHGRLKRLGKSNTLWHSLAGEELARFLWAEERGCTDIWNKEAC